MAVPSITGISVGYLSDGTGFSIQIAHINDGGSPILGYHYAVIEGHSQFLLENALNNSNTHVSAGTSRTFSIGDLDVCSPYSFGIRAENSDGYSEWWRYFNSDITACVPTRPANVEINRSGTSATVSWTASNPNRSALTRYEIRRNVGTSVGGTWVQISSTATSHTFTNLDPNEFYTYQVRARNGVGYSSIATVRLPSPPTDLTTTIYSLSIVVAWTAPSNVGLPALSGYQYRYREGSRAGGSWTDITGIEVQIPDLEAGTEITVDVRSVSDAGVSAPSAVCDGQNACF